LNRVEDAKNAARQAVKVAPDSGEGWSVLGAIYLAENRPSEALDALRKANDLSPRDQEISRQLSIAYGRVSDPNAAQKTGAPMSPSNPGATPGVQPSPTPAAPAVPTNVYVQFITDNLRRFEEGDVPGLMSKYAPKVVYYRYGVVEKPFIEKDLQRYFARWPMTKARLVDAVEVLNTPKPDQKLVRFKYKFRAAAPDRKAFSVGTAWNTWNVWETPDGLKVFGEDQNVVLDEPASRKGRSK
jgi:tetratricopeptide (TPR) repeat protein